MPSASVRHDDRAEGGRAADHAETVAGILNQLIEPDGNPHRPCVFFGERNAAERPQRRGTRVVGGHAAVDVVRRPAFDVVADIGVEIVENVSFHAGLRTRAMARASVSHFDVSTASCLRPLGVSR
jgi:hypothetical protein